MSEEHMEDSVAGPAWVEGKTSVRWGHEVK